MCVNLNQAKENISFWNLKAESGNSETGKSQEKRDFSLRRPTQAGAKAEEKVGLLRSDDGVGWRFDLGGFLEFDFGGVAEGVEYAEEEVGGDVLGVAVHDGGEASARGTREAGDLSVRQAFAPNDFDDF
jgi:hypothetical protein